jgi:hypothetical protein
VQFQEIDKEIIIFLGWKSLLWKHELKVNDILLFKLQHSGFKVKIFSAAFSTQVSCLGFLPLFSRLGGKAFYLCRLSSSVVLVSR